MNALSAISHSKAMTTNFVMELSTAKVIRRNSNEYSYRHCVMGHCDGTIHQTYSGRMVMNGYFTHLERGQYIYCPNCDKEMQEVNSIKKMHDHEYFCEACGTTETWDD